jgi:hypothetical protein
MPVWLKGAILEHGRLGSDVEDAILDEASQLDDVALDRARSAVAKSLLGMSTVAKFDDAISAVREERMKSAQKESETLPEEEPWPDPVTDIGEVMDEAATELRRYVVMDEPSLHTVVTWSVFAHIILNDQLKLNVAPRLATQSSDPGMGKTTLLEGLACLTPRPNMVGSTTASSIFRTIAGRRPTYLLDEIDNLLHHNADPTLKAILNSGHRKRSAYAERVEKQPNGSFKVLRLGEGMEAGSASPRVDWPVYPRRVDYSTLAKGGIEMGRGLRIAAVLVRRALESTPIVLGPILRKFILRLTRGHGLYEVESARPKQKANPQSPCDMDLRRPPGAAQARARPTI